MYEVVSIARGRARAAASAYQYKLPMNDVNICIPPPDKYWINFVVYSTEPKKMIRKT